MPAAVADKQWVLFDLDGTLLDYDAAERAAVLATLADAGLPTTEAVVETYRRANEAQWKALERGETTAQRLRVDRWREVLATHGLASDDVDHLAHRYLGHLAAGTAVVDGAEEVLARVRRSHRVAFITNGLADVQRPRIEGSSLAGLAEVVVISDEVGAAKPDPAIFDAAFDQMGHPPRDTAVMVGDSLTSDVAGGVAYGLDTVWLAPPRAPWAPDPQPTHRIGNLRELPPLLGA